MGCDPEALFRAELSEPRFELAVGQFHDTVALGADEVMMVGVSCTKAVASLGRSVHQGVDDGRAAEDGQRAVHRCEPDAVSLVAQPRMDLLRRRIVRLGRERLEDEDALPRWPDPARDEEPLVVSLGLRRVRHLPRLAKNENENHSHYTPR